MSDVYVVTSADYQGLSGIAKKYNTTVAELLKLNRYILPPDYTIYPGNKIQLPSSIQKTYISVLKKVIQYTKDNTPNTKPEDNGTECKKNKPIEKEEVILIVGTEQHSATYGNKMMFPAQAVREVNQNYSTNEYVTILIFTDGFNAKELTQVKESAISHNSNVNFIKINSATELIKHINDGTSKITRTSPNPKNHIVKIKIIKIFAHGLASTFDFGLDGSNREAQKFKISHVSQLKVSSFMPKPEIYSYACRTGNGDTRLIASASGYTYGSDWLEISKPSKSLAQELANYLDAKVYAYLKRSLYTATWLTEDEEYWKGKKILEDESVSNPIYYEDVGREVYHWWEDKEVHWDEALWNTKGGYKEPTSANSPLGLPNGMYIFEKNKEPRSK